MKLSSIVSTLALLNSAIAGSTRTTLANSIVSRISSLVGKSNEQNGAALCKVCKESLKIAKTIAHISNGEVLTEVIETLCDTNDFFRNSKACIIPHNQAMAVDSDGAKSTFINDAANVLSLMDTQGLDGELFCHHFLFNACPAPTELPEVDLSSWWPQKPENAVEPPPSNKRFNVLHLSDIHFQKGYVEGSEAECVDFMCCRDISSYERSSSEPSMPAPHFGYYKCDTPEPLMRSSLEHVTEGELDYEFAIFTGDMVDHNPVFVSYEESIQEEEDTLWYLKNYLRGVPVYPVLGNHDTYPFSQIAQDSSGYSNLFTWNADLMASLWEDYEWIDSDTAQMVREHYGGFAVTTKRGLRIISINSNFWYIWNMYNYWNTTNPDTSGILKFLTKELLDCEENGQRAWIMAHVPPNGYDTLAIPVVGLTQIIERFSPHVIAGLFFGHTHQDEFQVVYNTPDTHPLNEDDKSVENVLTTAWISQSITPLTNFNPGWRYYEVDAETFSIMDSHNYYTRLNDSYEFELDELDWQHLYSARDTYIPDWPCDAPLNATYWHRVANLFLNEDDAAHNYLGYGYRESPYTPACFDDQCRKEQYCYTTSFNPVQRKMCMESI